MLQAGKTINEHGEEELLVVQPPVSTDAPCACGYALLCAPEHAGAGAGARERGRNNSTHCFVVIVGVIPASALTSHGMFTLPSCLQAHLEATEPVLTGATRRRAKLAAANAAAAASHGGSSGGDSVNGGLDATASTLRYSMDVSEGGSGSSRSGSFIGGGGSFDATGAHPHPHPHPHAHGPAAASYSGPGGFGSNATMQASADVVAANEHIIRLKVRRTSRSHSVVSAAESVEAGLLGGETDSVGDLDVAERLHLHSYYDASPSNSAPGTPAARGAGAGGFSSQSRTPASPMYAAALASAGGVGASTPGSAGRKRSSSTAFAPAAMPRSPLASPYSAGASGVINGGGGGGTLPQPQRAGTVRAHSTGTASPAFAPNAHPRHLSSASVPVSPSGSPALSGMQFRSAGGATTGGATAGTLRRTSSAGSRGMRQAVNGVIGTPGSSAGMHGLPVPPVLDASFDLDLGPQASQAGSVHASAAATGPLVASIHTHRSKHHSSSSGSGSSGAGMGSSLYAPLYATAPAPLPTITVPGHGGGHGGQSMIIPDLLDSDTEEDLLQTSDNRLGAGAALHNSGVGAAVTSNSFSWQSASATAAGGRGSVSVSASGHGSSSRYDFATAATAVSPAALHNSYNTGTTSPTLLQYSAAPAHVRVRTGSDGSASLSPDASSPPLNMSPPQLQYANGSSGNSSAAAHYHRAAVNGQYPRSGGSSVRSGGGSVSSNGSYDSLGSHGHGSHGHGHGKGTAGLATSIVPASHSPMMMSGTGAAPKLDSIIEEGHEHEHEPEPERHDGSSQARASAAAAAHMRHSGSSGHLDTAGGSSGSPTLRKAESSGSLNGSTGGGSGSTSSGGSGSGAHATRQRTRAAAQREGHPSPGGHGANGSMSYSESGPPSFGYSRCVPGTVYVPPGTGVRIGDVRIAAVVTTAVYAPEARDVQDVMLEQLAQVEWHGVATHMQANLLADRDAVARSRAAAAASAASAASSPAGPAPTEALGPADLNHHLRASAMAGTSLSLTNSGHALAGSPSAALPPPPAAERSSSSSGGSVARRNANAAAALFPGLHHHGHADRASDAQTLLSPAVVYDPITAMPAAAVAAVAVASAHHSSGSHSSGSHSSGPVFDAPYLGAADAGSAFARPHVHAHTVPPTVVPGGSSSNSGSGSGTSVSGGGGGLYSTAGLGLGVGIAIGAGVNPSHVAQQQQQQQQRAPFVSSLYASSHAPTAVAPAAAAQALGATAVPLAVPRVNSSHLLDVDGNNTDMGQHDGDSDLHHHHGLPAPFEAPTPSSSSAPSHNMPIPMPMSLPMSIPPPPGAMSTLDHTEPLEFDVLPPLSSEFSVSGASARGSSLPRNGSGSGSSGSSGALFSPAPAPAPGLSFVPLPNLHAQTTYDADDFM